MPRVATSPRLSHWECLLRRRPVDDRYGRLDSFTMRAPRESVRKHGARDVPGEALVAVVGSWFRWGEME
jgi:hypothetical protein